MKDQFYVVLPSNSSMQYYPDNTTTHFITQLPQQIRLHGSWSVALTEIQIPLTFQHLSQEDVRVIMAGNLSHLSHVSAVVVGDNSLEFASEEGEIDVSQIHPGVYKDVEGLIAEMNDLECVKKNHLLFIVERGGYVRATRTCNADCKAKHEFALPEKLKKILGFDDVASQCFKAPVTSNRPAHLMNGLPNMLMLYTDICEPYVTGDVQAKLLRAISLNMDEFTYGGIKIKNFSPPMYIPLLINSFQTIEIDIRDQRGNSIPFDFGTLTATLHFKRMD